MTRCTLMFIQFKYIPKIILAQEINMTVFHHVIFIIYGRLKWCWHCDRVSLFVVNFATQRYDSIT